jgi:hypothetical protein
MCQTDHELVTMSLPKAKGMLYDPNIWIGDTGASTHSTAHMQGMLNMKDGSGAVGIQGFDGSTHMVDNIGDIPGEIHDQYGNPVAKVTLKNVSYSAENVFNVISIPQLLVKHWTLDGASDYITVTSPDGVEIKFDIIIPTAKGRIYAVCMNKDSNDYVHQRGSCQARSLQSSIDSTGSYTFENSY